MDITVIVTLSKSYPENSWGDLISVVRGENHHCLLRSGGGGSAQDESMPLQLETGVNHFMLKFQPLIFWHLANPVSSESGTK